MHLVKYLFHFKQNIHNFENEARKTGYNGKILLLNEFLIGWWFSDLTTI